LPSTLQYDANSATIVYAPAYTSPFWTPPVLTVVGNTIEVTAPFLDHPDSPVSAGIVDRIVIQYQATVLGPPTAGAAAPGATIMNTANLGYDSYFLDSGSFPTQSRDYSTADTADITVNSNSISGFIYVDVNNNGIYESATEPLITTPVDLRLTGTDHLGNGVVATLTNVTSGTYTFSGLRPGTYQIEELTQPTGYVDGIDTPGVIFGAIAISANPPGDVIANIIIPLDSNAAATDYNFGELLPATIGDFVWHDRNGNGVQDSGEPGLEGVIVSLSGTDDAGNSVSAAIASNISGAYSFTGLRPGTYQVTFTTPGGFRPTAQNSPQGTSSTDSDGNSSGVTASFTLTAGQTNNDIDQGYYIPVNLGDRVWFDINADGLQDLGEPGLNGVSVLLDYAGLDGTFGTADDQPGVDNRTTSGDGDYLFSSLAPGTYRVRVDATTLPAGINDPTFDLDGIATAHQAQVALASGVDNLGVDFGYTGTGFIGDRVWYDLGTTFFDILPDGIDNGEPGIPGVTVTLIWFGLDDTFGTSDDVTYTDVTDFNGNYGVGNLPFGRYQVTTNATTLFPGLRNTYDFDGPVLDLGTSTFPDGVAVVPISAARPSEDGADFGYFATNFFGDTIYLDLDGDGSQDAGEPGLGNVQVTAVGANTGLTFTRTTSSNGFYLFVGLPADTYTVTVVSSTLPPGLGVTEDPDVPLDGMATVVMATDTRRLDIDWGYVGSNSLSGFVYRDFDLDGNRELAGTNPETGIAGVTITLVGNTTASGGAMSSFTLTTQTDATGAYSFVGLPDAVYTVTETQPPAVNVAGQNGFYDGFDTPGTGGTSASSPANDRLQVTLASGQHGVEFNFGEIPPADPFGFVYIDFNENGSRDAGEPGIAGVSVTVVGTAFAGTALARPLVASDILPGGSLTVVTDANGRWEFAIMPPGVYTFTETQPLAFDDGLEEDADPNGPPATVGNDVFSNVVLNPFPVRGPFNFGELAVNGELRGTVYADPNNNGFRDANEVGLPGVTVFLTGLDLANTVVNASVVTDANGNFAFLRLRPGTYQLSEVQPRSFLDGLDRAGTLGGIVSNDLVDSIVLSANQVGINYLFGEQGWNAGMVTKRSFLAGGSSFDLLPAAGSGVVVVNPIPGSPLQLAGTALPGIGVPTLSSAQLARAVDSALNIFAGLGVDPLLIERLKALSFQIADLPGTELGRAFANNLIVIDSNAAGHGWSLGDSVAPDEVDLLSVVLHELGHELGLSHSPGFMDEYLDLGTRRLPSGAELDAFLSGPELEYLLNAAHG
ncbi:MAG: SdrD B-like domain-containing protein, partial [Gemmataceae bacterium]